MKHFNAITDYDNSEKKSCVEKCHRKLEKSNVIEIGKNWKNYLVLRKKKLNVIENWTVQKYLRHLQING